MRKNISICGFYIDFSKMWTKSSLQPNLERVSWRFPCHPASFRFNYRIPGSALMWQTACLVITKIIFNLIYWSVFWKNSIFFSLICISGRISCRISCRISSSFLLRLISLQNSSHSCNSHDAKVTSNVFKLRNADHLAHETHLQGSVKGRADTSHGF